MDKFALGVKLDKLHGAEEEEGAAEEHGGADGVFFSATPAAERGEGVAEFDGFVVGGGAELIDAGGGHLHQQQAAGDAFGVLLMPAFQTEADFFEVKETLDFPAAEVAFDDGERRLVEVGKEDPAQWFFAAAAQLGDDNVTSSHHRPHFPSLCRPLREDLAARRRATTRSRPTCARGRRCPSITTGFSTLACMSFAAVRAADRR